MRPISFGRHAVLLPEFFGEIAGVVEAGHIADIGNTFVGRGQGLGRLQKAELIDVLNGRRFGEL